MQPIDCFTIFSPEKKKKSIPELTSYSTKKKIAISSFKPSRKPSLTRKVTQKELKADFIFIFPGEQYVASVEKAFYQLYSSAMPSQPNPIEGTYEESEKLPW